MLFSNSDSRFVAFSLSKAISRSLSRSHYFCPLRSPIATDYSFTCLLRFMSVVVCCSLSGMDGNCNFSAVRSPIGLKLSGDLGLVSQISVHVLVSRFVYFLYCKQTKEQKIRRNRENRGFTKLAFSPPCRVR
jgi:hypothetical protein